MKISHVWQRHFCARMVCLCLTAWETWPLPVIYTYIWRSALHSWYLIDCLEYAIISIFFFLFEVQTFLRNIFMYMYLKGSVQFLLCPCDKKMGTSVILRFYHSICSYSFDKFSAHLGVSSGSSMATNQFEFSFLAQVSFSDRSLSSVCLSLS
jgi:hypothetical protein